MTSIGGYAFYNCRGLTSIEIPNSVTSIESGVFYDCTGLHEIHSKNPTPPTAHTNSFENVKTDYCKLYVPKGSVESYQFADVWTNFTTILEEGASETESSEEDDTYEIDENYESPVIKFNRDSFAYSISKENATIKHSLSVAEDENGKIVITATAYALYDNNKRSTSTTLSVNLSELESGDMNDDGNLNVVDVSILVKKILCK